MLHLMRLSSDRSKMKEEMEISISLNRHIFTFVYARVCSLKFSIRKRHSNFFRNIQSCRARWTLLIYVKKLKKKNLRDFSISCTLCKNTIFILNIEQHLTIHRMSRSLEKGSIFENVYNSFAMRKELLKESIVLELKISTIRLKNINYSVLFIFMQTKVSLNDCLFRSLAPSWSIHWFSISTILIEIFSKIFRISLDSIECSNGRSLLEIIFESFFPINRRCIKYCCGICAAHRSSMMVSISI